MRQTVLRSTTLALLAAALLLGACASEEERFEAHLAQAEEYRAAGRAREALLELRSALKLRSKSALTNQRIAEILAEQGRYQEAVFFYREAQRLDPDWVEPILAEIPLLFGAEVERAEELVERALELAPENPAVHRRRAELALVQGDPDLALTAALTGLELAPDDPVLSHQLGLVHRARIQDYRLRNEDPPEELFREALAAFERADAGEGSVDARLERARTFLAWPGHRAEAEEAYRAAAALAAEREDVGQSFRVALEALSFGTQRRDPKLRRWALERLVEIDPEALQRAARTGDADYRAELLSAWAQLAQLERAEGGSGEAVFARLIERHPDDPDLHLLYARFLFTAGKQEEAFGHLAEVAERGVEAPVMLDESVRLALLGQRVEDADAFVERLRAAHPGEPRTLVAEARLALARGRPGEAVDLLGRANETGESAESHRLLALAALATRDLPAAVQAIDRSLELAPNDAEAIRLKARIQLATADWTGTVQTLRRLRRLGLALDPEDRLALARSFYELDRPDTGRAILEEMLAVDAPPPIAVLAYARNEGPRNPERAAELVAAALARFPSNVPLISSATTLDLRTGKTERAIARLDAALEARPEHPRLRLLRARTLMQAGRLEEAERDALHAFDRSPDLPGALPLVLALYRTQGKLDAAIERLEEGARSGQLTPRSRALLGNLYMQRGDAERARAAYEAALRDEPGLAGVKNNLAFLLAKEGTDLDRALRLAQEAQEQLGAVPTVVDTLGYVFLRKGLAAPATEQFRYALSLVGDAGEGPPSIHYHLGLALRALGREKEAAAEFEKALAIDPEFPEAEDARAQLEQSRAAGADEAAAPPS